jgi:hypothetical protein
VTDQTETVVARIRTYLRLTPGAKTLGGEIAYCEDFRSDDWPRGCYAPTREDVEVLLAAVPSAVPAPATDRAALVELAAQAIRDSNGTPEALEWWRTHPQLIPAHVYAAAVLAVLPASVDRATVLREAATVVRSMDSDYALQEAAEHLDGLAVEADEEREAQAHLDALAEELAVEARDGQTTQDEAPCPDPIECSHEAALGQARETNRRLNLRAQKLESELAAYRRAVDQWEVSKRGTYVPLRTIAAIAKAAGRDIETPQWLLHYQRVEQAEAAIERVRALHQPIAGEADTQWCQVCSQEEHQPQPIGWWVPWPCPTLQALDLPAVVPGWAGEEPADETPKTPPTVGYSGKGRVWCLRCPHPADEDVPVTGREVSDWEICASCGRHVLDVARWVDERAAAQQPKEAENPRTVCVCSHTKGEHITVSGRLLCDACDPDSTENLTCTGFEAL